MVSCFVYVCVFHAGTIDSLIITGVAGVGQ